MEKLDISVLLVEDDAVIRNIYKQILSQFIGTLHIAVDGENGYNSYLDNKPDLIITDIKMPVMNGLDMIKKIRDIDKSMRIIIMSAYGESRFFINAIEYGVKGFLVKPVDTDHLKNVILEQANEILLEKRLQDEAHLREVAETQRDKVENILRSLLDITTFFFTSGVNDESINNTLSIIGNTTQVSRVYIFKNHESSGNQVMSQIYEWVNDGIKPEIGNPELLNIPLGEQPALIFSERMSKRLNLSGKPDDFDEPLRSILLEQEIKSLLTIPIYVRDEWWGFIGFDDCIEERSWTDPEINALEMLALVLGGAIYRGEVESQMKMLNTKLEERVYERTKELELEIDERTTAQALLKDSEEKYRLIYENANDGIFLLINNIVTLINPKVSEIFRELPRDIIGSELSAFVKDNYKKELDDYFTSNFDPYREMEMQAQLTNGNWIEMKSTSIYWNSEAAYLVFTSDISKRKIAEKKLNKLNKNLELRIREEVGKVNAQQQLLVQKSKLESIGELSAGLAHEINQPLGGISMGLENILFNLSSDGLNEEYLRSKIDILFSDIDRIQKIIEHVRIFSREQDKKITEKVYVNQVIQNALSLVSKQLIGRNIEIISSIDEDVEIMGNQFRLEQVILNIISNARHALEDKDKKIAPKTFSKRINIDLQKNTPFGYLIIADNGTGVSQSIISRVFDPFFTTKSEEKGTGLGLSISYGIISEMSGTIDIESEENEYTRVIIKLPLA